MTRPDIDIALLPPDWEDVRGRLIAHRAYSNLLREMPEDHRLRGAGAETVAVRQNRKDVVFWLSAEDRWALTHFTGRVETDPAWPWTEVFETWDALIDRLPPPNAVI